jgi:hypothetical protein
MRQPQRDDDRLAHHVVHRFPFGRDEDLAHPFFRNARRAALNHQMLGAHLGGVTTEDRGAFDDVFQLAHVPRPPMHLESDQRVVREVLRLLMLAHRFAQKVSRDGGDVFHALAERRQCHREDVQAIVEIFAELAAGDHFLEQRARRRDDAAADRELL